MAKNVFAWVGIAFLVYFVTRRPDTAADVVKAIGNGMLNVGQGFGDFFAQLAAR